MCVFVCVFVCVLGRVVCVFSSCSVVYICCRCVGVCVGVHLQVVVYRCRNPPSSGLMENMADVVQSQSICLLCGSDRR